QKGCFKKQNAGAASLLIGCGNERLAAPASAADELIPVLRAEQMPAADKLISKWKRHASAALLMTGKGRQLPLKTCHSADFLAESFCMAAVQCFIESKT
ncbi:MAG: hypothetical protein LUE64_05615, partial [Candidatus Gastranaerophilales bacterium]|nr:hypothetical protein [Candidatus Gastranaerophilales bacterium]